MKILDIIDSIEEEEKRIPWWIIPIIGAIVSLFLYWLYNITQSSFWAAWFCLSVLSTPFITLFIAITEKR